MTEGSKSLEGSEGSKSLEGSEGSKSLEGSEGSKSLEGSEGLRNEGRLSDGKIFWKERDAIIIEVPLSREEVIFT